MLVNLSKQEIQDLIDFDSFIDKTGTLPKYWMDHTEWGIKKERFRKVITKLKGHTNEQVRKVGG